LGDAGHKIFKGNANIDVFGDTHINWMNKMFDYKK
jgi:hypothetical protein